MTKDQIRERFALGYIIVGLVFGGISFAAIYGATAPRPAEVKKIAQAQLGSLDTERMATAFLAQQADDAGIVVISQKVVKVKQPNPNTLVYTIALVGDYGAGRTRYTVDVTVAKGIYRVSESHVVKQEQVQL